MNDTRSDIEAHYKIVIKAILDDRVVPFFGAGVNLCGRPKEVSWQPRGQYLPSGRELSAHLAEHFDYPVDDKYDLVRVSQYIAVMIGLGPLYGTLHPLFDTDYTPTSLHQFFANLPGRLREKAYPPCYQLIVTTNYDDLMEQAFRQAGEPFDLVCYVAEGEQRGKFLHWPPNGEARPIERPNEYCDLSLKQRPIILKIHGAVRRNQSNPGQDSYVITEDHYIDYLARTDLSNFIPMTLKQKLIWSHLLFLGYSLRDWNLRVILHRIWGERKLTYKSWAIQLDPERLDQEFWRKRNVDIFNVSLEAYIAGLDEQLRAFPAGAPA